MTASSGDARSTRHAYRDALAELIEADRRVVCLDSDTGLFDSADLRETGRYVNLGIAEHTLMGVAAGLAACGKLPFVNTMATFASTRALEAVKIDIACNALPVCIAATHGGLAAGHLGPTHHALEDLAIMRVLPSMTVVVPADAAAAEAAVRQTMALPGPVYLRLGREPTPPLGGDAVSPVIGRAQPLRPGDDLTIVACGPYPVLAAVRASETLASAGVGAAVLNLHTLKPLDVGALVAAAERSAALITVEEHWRLGGLGAAVAETLAELAPTRIARIGMPDLFVDAPGEHRDLLERYGIDHRAIVARALALLSRSRTTRGWRIPLADRQPAATSMEVPG
jgi:transketolase